MRRYLSMLRLILIRNGWKRAAYTKRIGYFHSQGDNCYLQPYNYGTEPKLISMGSNVWIASGVTFFTHDVIALMLRRKNGEHVEERVGGVRIGSNVFVGGGLLSATTLR